MIVSDVLKGMNKAPQMVKIIKVLLSIVIFIFPLMASFSWTSEGASWHENKVQDNCSKTLEFMKDTINITIGEKHFTAILESNPAATEFKKMLPLTITMKDLNNNEKFFDFSNNLPANVSNPRTIQSGDLMLWGSNTLVLFYKTFSTSYSYTRLGKIEDASGLAQAVGSGNVTVTFEHPENR
jgi:hypothetical protein